MIIELAEMKINYQDLKKGDEVIVLSRYDISSMTPSPYDICRVYANGKVYEVMSNDFDVKDQIETNWEVE